MDIKDKNIKRSKVEPFPGKKRENWRDEPEDFFKETLMDEADQYEKELGFNRNLDNIEVSPNVFQRIVKQLKENGKWYEQPEEDAFYEEYAKGLGLDVEKKHIANEENFEDTGILQDAVGAENGVDPCKLLNERDRIALDIGRRKLGRAKLDKIIKVVVTSAAVLVCVLGVGLMSGANKEKLITTIKTITDGEINVRIKGGGKEQGATTEKLQESAVWGEVCEKLGIAPIQFQFIPDGMEFYSSSVSQDAQSAIVQYMYNDTIINVSIHKYTENSETNFLFDGKVIETFNTSCNKNEMLEVNGVQNPSNEIAYVTMFDYNNAFYSISAIMSKEEFTKLLNNMKL